MKIIKAHENDIPTISKIAEISWKENYPGIISEQQILYMLEQMYSEKELRVHFQNPNYHYFLIQNDKNETIGIMGFEKGYETETTKLHRIYLLKSEKGKGYGKLGLHFLKNWVKEAGDKRIILNVNKKNPAKEVYKSQGFTIYKEEVLNIGNGFVMDDFLMEYRFS